MDTVMIRRFSRQSLLNCVVGFGCEPDHAALVVSSVIAATGGAWVKLGKSADMQLSVLSQCTMGWEARMVYESPSSVANAVLVETGLGLEEVILAHELGHVREGHLLPGCGRDALQVELEADRHMAYEHGTSAALEALWGYISQGFNGIHMPDESETTTALQGLWTRVHALGETQKGFVEKFTTITGDDSGRFERVCQ